ncbi:right-handed parallel beta-helix repeat-containing protein [Candidatus Woesearchaeota archaeon]|nr:right-handed parallel beta-helix repeat-containing protein [Nanoarchaeota archaeon]MCB9370143.1 right-handed parallel beta-helix repeat-containing protein [Candidatus Woesearchaeota archaeon]USN44673.1 MAG: right-handed parallel beta-helix repeat-containing protein [Candidatus Woesearchaeota archaeon]
MQKNMTIMRGVLAFFLMIPFFLSGSYAVETYDSIFGNKVFFVLGAEESEKSLPYVYDMSSSAHHGYVLGPVKVDGEDLVFSSSDSRLIVDHDSDFDYWKGNTFTLFFDVMLYNLSKDSLLLSKWRNYGFKIVYLKNGHVYVIVKDSNDDKEKWYDTGILFKKSHYTYNVAFTFDRTLKELTSYSEGKKVSSVDLASSLDAAITPDAPLVVSSSDRPFYGEISRIIWKDKRLSPSEYYIMFSKDISSYASLVSSENHFTKNLPQIAVPSEPVVSVVVPSVVLNETSTENVTPSVPSSSLWSDNLKILEIPAGSVNGIRDALKLDCDSGCRLVLGEGVYETGGIEFLNLESVVIEGQGKGKTIFRNAGYSNTEAMLSFVNSNNILLKDFTVDLNNFSGMNGILFHETTGQTLENVEVINAKEEAILSTVCEVCEETKTGPRVSVGISDELSSLLNTNLKRIDVPRRSVDMLRQAIDACPETGCHIVLGEGVYETGGIDIENKENLVLEGQGSSKTILRNSGYANTEAMVRVLDSKNITLRNFGIDGGSIAGLHGVLLRGTRDSTVENLIVRNVGGSGIKTNGVCSFCEHENVNNLIRNNYVDGWAYNGIDLYFARSNVVRGNEVTNGVYVGIISYTEGKGNVIEDNFVHDLSQDGIQIRGREEEWQTYADANVVRFNRVENVSLGEGTASGILINVNTKNTVVASNFVSGTEGNCIKFSEQSLKNLLDSNYVDYCGVDGISTSGSASSGVAKNNIIGFHLWEFGDPFSTQSATWTYIGNYYKGTLVYEG